MFQIRSLSLRQILCAITLIVLSFGAYKYAASYRIPQASCPTIWLHAHSAGEMLALQRLVDELRETLPGLQILITSDTAEGVTTALKHLKPDTAQQISYNSPVREHLEIYTTLAKLFATHQPRALLLMEHEVVPEMILCAQSSHVPVYVINAQVTPTQQMLWTEHAQLFSMLFGQCKKVFVQSEQDKQHFMSMFTLSEEKIEIMGNIKTYNAEQKKLTLAQELPQRPATYKQQYADPIILGGSIHPGELDAYLTMFKQVRQTHPQARLILAPRHFSWKQELLDKTSNAGWQPYMLDEESSLLKKNPDAVLNDLTAEILPMYDVVMVCAMGHLFYLYPLADIYCLGGTFVPVGGHNLLEPMMWALPTIIGPHYQNTRDIAQDLINAHAVTVATGTDEFAMFTERLLSDHEQLNAMKTAAQTWFENNVGMTTQCIQALITELSANENAYHAPQRHMMDRT